MGHSVGTNIEPTRQASHGVTKRADTESSPQNTRRVPPGDFIRKLQSPVEYALERCSMTTSQVSPNRTGVGNHGQHVRVDYELT